MVYPLCSHDRQTPRTTLYEKFCIRALGLWTMQQHQGSLAHSSGVPRKEVFTQETTGVSLSDLSLSDVNENENVH